LLSSLTVKKKLSFSNEVRNMVEIAFELKMNSA